MGEFLIFERMVWFHDQVRNKKFPNANQLSEHFELSNKTAQRTIDFFRDRFEAPLEYDPARRGYRYSEESFELPFLQASQEELLAILLARNLLEKSAGGLIGRAIQKFGKKLFSVTKGFGLSNEIVKSCFSAVWNGYSPAQAEIFRLVCRGLLRRKPLVFSYHSPATGATTERKVEPHHLQHYMASWVLIAWCRNRNAWRKFFLSRMSNLSLLNETFNPRREKDWHYLKEESFGIFQGSDSFPVTLRFTRFRAGWIREQLWHPRQKIEDLPNGGVLLSFPAADFREVKMKILQFGADVEVVSPGSLREEVRAEIERMVDLYTI